MASNNVKKSVTIFINGKQAEATVGNLRKKSRELNNEINQLVPGTDAYIKKSKELEKVNKRLDKHRKAVKGVGGAFGGIKSALSSTAASLFGVTAVIGGVVAAFNNALGIIKDYESANSKLQAVLGENLSILGDTEEQMEALTDQSKELGAVTAFTATEVAQLQTEYAKLGFPTEDILEMTEATLDGAAAMGSELAPTAALVGATIRSFGLDAADAARVNDVLAAATSNSALDFDKLNESMSTVAPVANKLGFSLEDTTSLLGNLSDAGFDASSAATATRNILLGLADSNGALAKSLGEPVKDLPGLITGLKKLQAEGTDLGEALELTDKRSVAAFATFLDGTNDIEKLQAALNDADGVAKKMADTMLDNLAGDTKIAQSAWEGMVLSVEDGSGPITNSLRSIVQGATNFLGIITDLNNGALTTEDKWRLVANFFIGFTNIMAKLATGVLSFVDIIAGTDLADSFQLDTLELTKTKVDAIDKAFKSVNKTQLQSKEVAKKVVAEYIKAGLTAEEAFKKYQKLAGVQKKTAEDIVDSTEDITDATVKQIDTIASLNAELSERKETLSTLEIGSKEFIKVQQEIIKIEKQLAVVNGKTAKERQKNADKALKDLEKLKTGVDKFRTELENREAIELLKTDEEKELAKLQQTLDKSFAKEIANAEKLAAGKGDVAVEAQKQLDALLLIKEQEFQAGKLKIQKETIAKEKKTQQEKNQAVLKVNKSLADAEVVIQQNKLDQISDKDFAAKKEQEDVLVQALKDRIEAEREVELNKLQEQRDNDLISQEEFLALRAIVNDTFRQQENDLDQARADRQIALRKQVTDAVVDFARFGIDAIAEFTAIQAEKDIQKSEDKAGKEIDILQKQLDEGAISQEEFEAKKLKIEEKADKEQAKIKRKAAQTEKQAAIIQATIDTALSVLKASAAVPPPLNIPLIALAAAQGAIQIGLIAAQPIPQFVEGGGTDRLLSTGTQKVIGADDGKLYNAKVDNERKAGLMKGGPRLMLVNEQKPEYFIPGDLLSNPEVANQIEIIEAIRTGKQFQDGGFTSSVGTIDDTETPEDDVVTNNVNAAVNAELVDAINTLNAKLAKGIFVVMTQQNIDDITDTQIEIAEIKGDVG